MTSSKINLNELTFSELQTLQRETATLIAAKENSVKALSEICDEIHKLIKTKGLSIIEVLAALSTPAKTPMLKEKGTRRPAAVKYRLGDNSWTGRGRKPNWVKAYLDEGGTLDALNNKELESSTPTLA